MAVSTTALIFTNSLRSFRLLPIQFAQLPRPQRQPENYQNQKPQKQLEDAQEPERHGLHEVPTDIVPPQGKHPCRPSRHEDEVYDPCQGQQRIADQDNPPSRDGGGPDFLLEWVV